MAQTTKKTARKSRVSSGSTGAKGRAGSGRSKSTTGNRNSSTKRTGPGQRSGKAAARSGGAGNNARRTAAVSRVKREEEQQQRELKMDIALVLLLLVMLFLYLSLLGLCGSVGDILARILAGFLGRSAWGAPLWTFAFCLFLLNGTGGKRMPARLTAFALLMLVAGAAFHLHLHTDHVFSLETAFDPARTFRVCSERLDGGGIVNGWFSWILYRAFGLFGSILAYFGLTVVGVSLLLQRSPAGFVRAWQQRREEEGIPGFAERRAARRQERIEELEKQEELRLERQAARILQREDSMKARRTSVAGRGNRRSSGRAIPDLEQTRIDGRKTGPGLRPDALRGMDRDRRNGSRQGGTVQTDRRRDIHEIVLLDRDEPLYTVPSSGNPSGENFPGGSVRGSRPEPGGTTYRRSEDADSILTGYPGREYPAGQAASSVSAFSGGSGRELPVSFEIRGKNPEEYPMQAPATEEERAAGGISRVRGKDPATEAGSAEREYPESPLFGPGETGNTEVAAGQKKGNTVLRPDEAGRKIPAFSPDGEAAQTAPLPAGQPLPSEEELSGIAVHREKGGAGKGRSVGRTAASGRNSGYKHPPYDLLTRGAGGRSAETERELQETAFRLQETLRTFGVQVTITDISQGPSVTRYELKPDQGVKVSKIVNLSDDIKLRLAATDIRIEAPIPGKSAIGIEVPNKTETTVHLRELLENRAFKRFEGKLPFAVGKDIGGKTVIADIARMPHLLIAGATGSGKSVCINTIILSILYRTSPEDVRLLMIDPKVVELSVYKKIPHLIIPVVTDARKASAALNWAVAEMEKRYKLFAAAGVRDLNGYNTLAKTWMGEDGEPEREPLPRLVIIVDELADLMMVSKNEVESAICRLAQLARAAGIHLIIATQRPSVDVITGLIKANMPSRIAFAVSSQVDSRTILDMAGAEKLIGRGDMLFYPQNYQKPARIQGAFVSDDEVTKVVDYIREHNTAQAEDADIDRQIDDIAVNGIPSSGDEEVKAAPARDEYFAEAGRFIIEKNKASIGLLQRVFKIGFNRAARIMDQLAEAGVVGEESSTRARQILMTMPEFEAYLENES